MTVKPLPPFLAAGLRKPAIARLLSSLGGGVLTPPPAPTAVKAEEGEEGEGNNTQEDGNAAAAAAPEGEEDVGSLSEEGLDMRLGARLPGVLRDALKGYQWVGAKFVVRRGGRGLIGDEMGTCLGVWVEGAVVGGGWLWLTRRAYRDTHHTTPHQGWARRCRPSRACATTASSGPASSSSPPACGARQKPITPIPSIYP